MFVDIRGYTSLVEHMEPAAVATRLNHFYEIATQAIFRYDGTLDKLVGDEVMAFFGAPLNWWDHPQRAVTAALEIPRDVATLPEQDRLQIGIGISTGPAFVGNVGGKDFTDYTVLGDTVNVAARLQGAPRQVKYCWPKKPSIRSPGSFPTRRDENWSSKARPNRWSPGKSREDDRIDSCSSGQLVLGPRVRVGGKHG